MKKLKRKLKKNIKRTIAFFLAFLTFAAVIPPVRVYAEPYNPLQPPLPVTGVRQPTITHGATPYNLTLGWFRPPAAEGGGHLFAGVPIPPGGETFSPHPRRYEILIRNATTGVGLPAVWHPMDIIPWADRGTPAHDTQEFRFDLAQHHPVGSRANIYGFEIRPERINWFRVDGVGGAPPTFHQLRAPFPVGTVHPEVLFMTSVNVQVENIDGNMVVTWCDPVVQFPGVAPSPAFTRYRLQYRLVGSATDIADIIVTRGMPGLETLPGQLRLTVPPGNIPVGMPVRVEVTPLADPAVEPPPALHFPTVIQRTIGGIQRRFTIAHANVPYYNDSFVLRPALRLVPFGLDALHLSWDHLPESMRPDILYVEVLAGNSSEFPFQVPPSTRLARLSGQHLINNLIEVPRPTAETWYAVVFRMRDGRIIYTDRRQFDPLHPGFEPYIPTIRPPIDVTTPPLTLSIDWMAFTRPPYNTAEATGPNMRPIPGEYPVYLDPNIIYDIWITEDLQLITGDHPPAGEPLMSISAGTLEASLMSIPGMPDRLTYFYSSNFTQFIRFVNGVRTVADLEENRVYYIRIQARRTVGEALEQSQPAFGSVFIPPSADIPLRPQMVPVRIAEDEDGLQMITENTITIEWDLVWIEAYDARQVSPPAYGHSRWHNRIGVTADNRLVFGDEIDAVGIAPDRVLELWDSRFVGHPNPVAAVQNALIALGLTREPAVSALPLRVMDMRNPAFSYRIHTVDYIAMGNVGYEGHFNRIVDDQDAWFNIEQGVPGPTPNQRRFTVTSSIIPPAALQPNTSYVIFFRPFSSAPGLAAAERVAHYPTYITATTLLPRPPLDIIPTVPILHVVGVTDTSVTLRWEGTHEMEYQLRWSELLIDHPEGGNLIDSGIITEDSFTSEEFPGYILFTVEGLFPDTLYHFWIRARAGVNLSVWSNPVSARTADLSPPMPPSAFAIASRTSLTAYNTENTTTLQTGQPNSLIIEFMRIFADLNNAAPGPASSDYTSSGGEATWLDSPSLTNTYMIMFDELLANRRYYIRGQTALTVARGDGPAGLIRSYSYIIQLALTDDFLDPIEIILPALGELNPNPSIMRRLHSDWSNVFSFVTGRTDEEYDGDVNPDLFPLPDQDFEFIYRWPGTLVYRFRSNQVDAQGNRDNQVDQRFISRLVHNRTFEFEVDVSRWGNWPVNERIVQIPVGILEAFDERQIDLIIRADNLTVTIPPGALLTQEVRRIPGLNRFTQAIINLSEAEAPGAGEANLTSRPHRLTVEFEQGIHSVMVTEFAQPVTIVMTMPPGHDLDANSIAGYINHPGTGGWRRLQSDFRPPAPFTITGPSIPCALGSVSFDTRELGSFAVMSTPAAENVGATAVTLPAMQRVNTHLRINDLVNYNENQAIHPNQFNQLVAAAAMREQDINMNSPLDMGTWQSLGRSGMLVPGDGTVSRQEGIASLVRLIEVRSGSAVSFFPGLAQSSFADMGTVSPERLEAMLKAEALGFIRGMTVNPNGELTFGDVMHILDIILSTS